MTSVVSRSIGRLDVRSVIFWLLSVVIAWTVDPSQFSGAQSGFVRGQERCEQKSAWATTACTDRVPSGADGHEEDQRGGPNEQSPDLAPAVRLFMQEKAPQL